ncbi:hypothetical protein H112_08090 [Trichophyton rubrum D6]|uniref:Uncharacterized protein n=3 Tax=Trichophyton TaxID=5550 RepID=A0A080WK36_TRIRC|nr:uncharacterized protein TERG_11610 [Trichophyton rubrum CBS 118892]EZF10640.1 hypothetical protein H100_08118 [Trichophyton rubrum MR850]EZF37565.1 hypothetical protein H102_08074 [Trichophyton rubrum CBS 100081]EZF48173.1 hypothetical protein H103_08102 [Trichophyton rubrum CBS 288.86]EZF58836.1 hypothetical protein H104_08049 [Trichophyton rubrum CBS 289.86]EZF69427.1 hypothetical protein H105_08101 [Trichophyton soudanense CBS 452.61]EZF80081.1 hypothetical protein H110_08103 [Trichophy
MRISCLQAQGEASSLCLTPARKPFSSIERGQQSSTTVNHIDSRQKKTADLRSCTRQEGRYKQSHSCIHSHLETASLVSQIRSSPIVGRSGIMAETTTTHPS